jgi:hypothetical protein
MISDLTEKTEPPPPLTQREMAQFVTLSTMPTLERGLERLRWLERELAERTAERDRMTGQRNAALDARDITQRTLDGIDGVLSQRTAERDEARREVCRLDKHLHWEHGNLDPSKFGEEALAAERGWDCFEEGNKTC